MDKKRRGRMRDLPFTLFICARAAMIAACGAYLYYHYWSLPRTVDARNARYAELYAGRATDFPAQSADVACSPAPKATIVPTAADNEVSDVAYGTPDPDTVVYSAPTLPPVQDSFAELLAMNPETVGYLTIGEMIALPVAQRENDNAYYLTHDFEGEESDEGCLFLDGVNRLEFDDKCLIVYGHNMKNGTMFGKLTNYAIKSVLTKNAIAYFDTIYENRAYVPFACFALGADPGDSEYFNFRRFQFTGTEFSDFMEELKSRSLYDIPVDVQSGDDILLLVTCNYSVDDGRFVLALRQLRPGETEEDMRALIGQATAK